MSPSSSHIRTPKAISHDRRFLFIAIRKSASQSLMAYFANDPSGDVEITYAPLSHLLRSEVGSYYKFSFVRNPFARAVSAFNDKIQTPEQSGQILRLMKYPHLSKHMTFEEFARWLNTKEGADRTADDHWMSQHLYLGPDDGPIACDYVGRIEEIDIGLKEIGRTLSINEWTDGSRTVGMANASARASATPTTYRKYYDDQTRLLIASRYGKDLDLFGYDF